MYREEVDNFLAVNTLPEGVCKQLLELPDGTPVWATYRKVERIKYTYFNNMEEVDNFLAKNTLPEGVCKQLGELPDGTPVWAKFEEEVVYKWGLDPDGYQDLIEDKVTIWVTAYVM